MQSRPIVEGFFVKTVEGLIFEIKGVVHPRNRYIAYLRYVPRGAHGSGLRKVYELTDRERFLASNHSSYLWTSHVHGRVVQSVPHERVKAVLDPVEHLGMLRTESRELTVLEQKAVKMAGVLVKHTPVDWTDIGLTGSLLIEAAGPSSDIDMVVYGEQACRSIYDHIHECPGVEKYSGSVLEKHVEFRWGALHQYTGILTETEQKKRLQGFFEGIEYFIRLVRRPGDLSYGFDDRTFEYIEHSAHECTVIGDKDSIFTPCAYQVESSSRPDLRQIVSFRGRYTEHVHTGDQVRVCGRMERVREKSGNDYIQIVVGEAATDYLVPF